MDNFTQEDINTILSNVNSFARKSLNNILAITLFETIYSKNIMDELNIKLINKNEVYLLPDLIEK
jgi:hypothetical protein